MKNLNENTIREAAYYIWKNAGCPANTSLQDWNAAIQQLSSCSCNNTNKTSSKNTSLKTSALKTVSLKKSSSASSKKATSTKKNSSKKSK